MANEKTFTLEEIKAFGERKNNNKLVASFPEGHFINDYVNWMSSLTDGYYEYQVCAALWSLSSVVRGKIALHLKQEVIKPNLWFTILDSSAN